MIKDYIFLATDFGLLKLLSMKKFYDTILYSIFKRDSFKLNADGLKFLVKTVPIAGFFFNIRVWVDGKLMESDRVSISLQKENIYIKDITRDSPLLLQTGCNCQININKKISPGKHRISIALSPIRAPTLTIRGEIIGDFKT